MAKRQNKSISELLGKRNAKPSLDEVNKIAEQIHDKKATPPPKKKEKRDLNDISNRTKRISLNAPLDLYLEIQREATLQGKPMMQYILEVVKMDIDAKK